MKISMPDALPSNRAMAPRLRLLCLAPQEPWPATDGGKEGIHGAAQALAEKAGVLLACPGAPASEAAAAHFASLGIDYRPVAFVPRETAVLIVSATLQFKPFKFHKYGTAEAERCFSATIGAFQPDAIVCFHAHMEELGQRLKRRRGWDVPVLVREHNIEYELVHSHLAARPLWQRTLAMPLARLTERTEKQIWARADVTAFLSDRDFATARESGVKGRLVLAPEGVPIPPFRTAARPAGSPALLIPLNRRAPQSVANLRRFLHEYWAPLASEDELSLVSLNVTGVDPKQLAEFADISVADQSRMRINALGFLPSLRPAFESALALVAPTFIGGGIRKKILEGMAYQVPVIATDLDIQTCSYFTHGENILRLGTPEDFGRSVSQLQCDLDLWHRLSDNGRRTVEQHADWCNFADVMLQELSALRAGRNGSTASRTALLA